MLKKIMMLNIGYVTVYTLQIIMWVAVLYAKQPLLGLLFIVVCRSFSNHFTDEYKATSGFYQHLDYLSGLSGNQYYSRNGAELKINKFFKFFEFTFFYGWFFAAVYYIFSLKIWGDLMFVFKFIQGHTSSTPTFIGLMLFIGFCSLAAFYELNEVPSFFSEMRYKYRDKIIKPFKEEAYSQESFMKIICGKIGVDKIPNIEEQVRVESEVVEFASSNVISIASRKRRMSRN